MRVAVELWQTIVPTGVLQHITTLQLPSVYVHICKEHLHTVNTVIIIDLYYQLYPSLHR